MWVTYLLLICLYLYPVDHCNFQTVTITTFYISDHWEEEKKNLVFLLPTNNLKMILGAIYIISTGHPPSQGIHFSSFITAGNVSPETLVRNSAGWSCCHSMGHWNTPGHTQICWREVSCLSSRFCKCLMFKRCQAKLYKYCRIKGTNFLIP